MATLAQKRLQMERVNFKKQRKYGFWAAYEKNEDGGQNLMKWYCKIKTKDQGPWAGATLRIRVEFTDEFPGRPPKCIFEKIDGEPLFHPNIYPSGTVCLSILNEDKDWRPILNVTTILIGIVDLLDAPNPNSPAQEDAYNVYSKWRNNRGGAQ